MNPIPRTIKIILISLILITSAAAYAFVNLGNRLLVSDPEPQKIDLIFTAAGAAQRYDHPIDLSARSTGNNRAGKSDVWDVEENKNDQGISENRILHAWIAVILYP